VSFCSFLFQIFYNTIILKVFYGGISEGNDEDLKYLSKDYKLVGSLYFQNPTGCCGIWSRRWCESVLPMLVDCRSLSWKWS